MENYDLQDDTLERVVSFDTDDKGQMVNVVTETIPAPMPKWKRMGFESRAAVMDNSDAGSDTKLLAGGNWEGNV